MISKKIIFLSCVLLIFLSIGNISAIDVNNTVQSSNVNLNEVRTSNEINEQDVLSISDENEIYGSSFKDLQDLIDNAQGELNLTNDYSLGFDGESVKISKNITINGPSESAPIIDGVISMSISFLHINGSLYLRDSDVNGEFAIILSNIASLIGIFS